MKKTLFFAALLSLFSCNYIMKNYDDKNKSDSDTLENVKVSAPITDKNCELKSGYKWSNIHNKCIRVFELGYRMSSIAKDSLGKSDNAYFFIEPDSLTAEVFLPDSTESVIMTRKTEDENFVYKNFQLKTRKGFLIYENKIIAFKPALAKDLPVVGKDEEY